MLPLTPSMAFLKNAMVIRKQIRMILYLVLTIYLQGV